MISTNAFATDKCTLCQEIIYESRNLCPDQLYCKGYELINTIDDLAYESSYDNSDLAEEIANDIVGFADNNYDGVKIFHKLYWSGDDEKVCAVIGACSSNPSGNGYSHPCTYMYYYFDENYTMPNGSIMPVPLECVENSGAAQNYLNNPGDLANCAYIKERPVAFCDQDLTHCATAQYGIIFTCDECTDTQYEFFAKEIFYGGLYSTTTMADECQVCNACSTCTDDTSWTIISSTPSKQKRDYATCDCEAETCEYETYYRCAPGYYGDSSSTTGSLSCTRCPAISDTYTDSAHTAQAYGTTTGGSTSPTQCYMQNGTYYEKSGTSIISGAGTICKYVE